MEYKREELQQELLKLLLFSQSPNTGRVAKTVDAVAWRRLRVILTLNSHKHIPLCYERELFLPSPLIFL